MTKYKSKRGVSFFDALLRKKKIFNVSFGFSFLISFFVPITNFSNIDTKLINYIIDDSPLKQNRFSPGKHIDILPRKFNIHKNIDIVIVFAFEYFKDIK